MAEIGRCVAPDCKRQGRRAPGAADVVGLAERTGVFVAPSFYCERHARRDWPTRLAVPRAFLGHDWESLTPATFEARNYIVTPETLPVLRVRLTGRRPTLAPPRGLAHTLYPPRLSEPSGSDARGNKLAATATRRGARAYDPETEAGKAERWRYAFAGGAHVFDSGHHGAYFGMVAHRGTLTGAEFVSLEELRAELEPVLGCTLDEAHEAYARRGGPIPATMRELRARLDALLVDEIENVAELARVLLVSERTLQAAADRERRRRAEIQRAEVNAA